MIKVDGLTIGFQGRNLFEEASFSIHRGERCGLVGRNGAGKTTLFRLISGEEVPDAGSIEMQKDYSLGLLQQHIRFSRPTLLEETALGLREEDQDNLYKVEAILFGLGFKVEDLQCAPEKLSGGYQLRLHLAKVLVSEPNCLLLDEPTNYLDIVSIRWFTRFLQQWKGEFILISHDREFMDSVSTHTMGIHREKVRKMKGTTVEFFEKILQEEEIQERTAQNLDKKRAHLQSFIDRFGAKATKAAQAESRRKMLQRIPVLEKLKDLYHLDFNFNEASFPGKKMIEASGLYFGYPVANAPLIVNDLSLEIEKGDMIAIIGKNGRGKSTILKLLAQEFAPGEGSIKHSDNLAIGYFGQTNIERLHPQNSVEDEIGAANRLLNKTEIKGICGVMMFSGDQASKPTSLLSGGERSRVLLGKILATPCNLLLLDEPTHHLDMESIEALIDALEEFQGAVVLVTHSELILRRLAINKIVICHQGQQELFLGGYDDFLTKKGWDEKNEGIANKSPKKVGDQREQRQQRAALVTARAKAIKPLDSAMEKLEKRISELEKQLHRMHTEVVEHSRQGAGQAIQKLSIEIAAQQTTLDQLYEQLDAVTTQRDALEAYYKAQMG